MRKAFTLIELLVVIGIIAVLTGIMIVSFGRSTESARAAKCLANMHNLAQGATSVAMSSGYYPFAGSVQSVAVSGSSVVYIEHKGWISWLSNRGSRSGSKSLLSCELPKYTGFGNKEDDAFVITNGTMWRAVNMNRDVYTCPSHSLVLQKRGGCQPLYSYVMNSYFGYDYSDGAKAVGWGLRKEYVGVGRGDRILMFAEVPVFDPKTGNYIDPPGGTQLDGVLQAKATVNGTSYGTLWDGPAESIGFNHKLGKKGYCAHVAFADGHAETFAYGDGSGLGGEELTALLCNGKDVVFEGKGYQEIRDNE